MTSTSGSKQAASLGWINRAFIEAGKRNTVFDNYGGEDRFWIGPEFSLPGGAARLPYVNSLWQQQKQPYAGDAVNSYNDGPATPGADSLGGFYELETSSPAAELFPERSITHVHRTFHFTGELAKVNALAIHILGLDLATVEFPKA